MTTFNEVVEGFKTFHRPNGVDTDLTKLICYVVLQFFFGLGQLIFGFVEHDYVAVWMGVVMLCLFWIIVPWIYAIVLMVMAIMAYMEGGKDASTKSQGPQTVEVVA